ncbi:hypothetical protein [Agarivorans sp. Alg241-V36]|uniref:hypothetical protein n=1 Tax=Agarivorans sp. Alg241-V36 TaxID=2305992 RepID=UPI0013D56BC8|nr:hypothetical protein [Agarivorans sp. Alg241-V36]
MKKLATAFVLIAFVTLTGCSSSIPLNAQPQTNTFTLPPIGKETQVYVGDYLINEGIQITDRYLSVKKTIDGAYYNIGQGHYKELGADNEGNIYFSHYSSNGGFVTPGVLVDPPYALSPNDKKGLCVSTVFVKNATCYEEAQTEVITKTVESSSAFEQTLIYNGSVGSKINISYREFAGGTARQAFTNNVEYDMSKSNIINYKGAVIEIISYNNSSITFKVIKHFRKI